MGHVRGHDIHGCGWGGESERDGGWRVEALVFWDGRDGIGVGDLGVVVRSLGLGLGVKRQVGRPKNKHRFCIIALVGDGGECSLPLVSKGPVSA